MEESTPNHIMTPSGANSLVFVAMYRTVVDDHLGLLVEGKDAQVGRIGAPIGLSAAYEHLSPSAAFGSAPKGPRLSKAGYRCDWKGVELIRSYIGGYIVCVRRGCSSRCDTSICRRLVRLFSGDIFGKCQHIPLQSLSSVSVPRIVPLDIDQQSHPPVFD